MGLLKRNWLIAVEAYFYTVKEVAPCADNLRSPSSSS